MKAIKNDIKQQWNVLFSLLLLPTIGLWAQTPTFEWGKVNFGSADDKVTGIAVDGQKNVIEIGITKTYSPDFNLQGNAFPQSPTEPGYNYGQAGYEYGDSYIVKYDSAGNMLWFNRTIGTFAESFLAVTTDHDDNIVITGLLRRGDPLYDQYSLDDNTNLLTRGFVMKLDPQGNPLWHRFLFGHAVTSPLNTLSGISNITNVEVDLANNIYFAGVMKADSMSAGNLSLTALDDPNVPEEWFIAKYGANGDPVWLSGVQGDNLEAVSRLGVDDVGNVYFSGSTFSDSVLVGGVWHVPAEVTANSFTAKLNNDGSLGWFDFNNYTDQGFSYPLSITETKPDIHGNAYIVGATAGGSLQSFQTHTVQFGANTFVIPYSPDVDSIRESFMFIAKYDATGQKLWMSTSEDLYNRSISVSGIDIDGNGCLTIGGIYVEPTTIEGGNLLPNADWAGSGSFAQNPAKPFIAKLNDQGDFLWSKAMANTFRIYITDIEVDEEGGIYTGGNYIQGDVEFDGTIVNGYPIQGGFIDGYVAKYQGATGNCYMGVGNEEMEAAKFTVYPNPATDEVWIQSTMNGALDVEIYSSYGQLIAQHSVNGVGKLTLPDARGIYYFKIIQNTSVRTIKVIKQ